MEKITFVNDSAPPLNANYLNLMQDNIETSINGVQGSNANGNYIKYDNGLLFQWGVVEAPASQGYADITFPIAFINTSYELLANHKYTGGSSYGGTTQLKNITSGQTNTTTTSYAYSYLPDGSVATYKRKITYFAIGKWK